MPQADSPIEMTKADDITARDLDRVYAPSVDKVQSAAALECLREAYACLRDDRLRKAYDQKLSTSSTSATSTNSQCAPAQATSFGTICWPASDFTSGSPGLWSPQGRRASTLDEAKAKKSEAEDAYAKAFKRVLETRTSHKQQTYAVISARAFERFAASARSDAEELFEQTAVSKFRASRAVETAQSTLEATRQRLKEEPERPTNGATRGGAMALSQLTADLLRDGEKQAVKRLAQSHRVLHDSQSMLDEVRARLEGAELHARDLLKVLEDAEVNLRGIKEQLGVDEKHAKWKRDEMILAAREARRLSTGGRESDTDGEDDNWDQLYGKMAIHSAS